MNNNNTLFENEFSNIGFQRKTKEQLIIFLLIHQEFLQVMENGKYHQLQLLMIQVIYSKQKLDPFQIHESWLFRK